MSEEPARKQPAVLARENRRTLLGLVAAVIAVVFALVNLDEVAVDWIFGTWQTPLIVVILVSFALGLFAGRIAAGRHRAKR